ncbi:hypothetical protein APUTEX25_001301 [Auxenochlorella protothecoides]|nr:hypothetical protein APUTEX25_001301 [Auxenochlorella protothecoides]|eukprot:RMZ52107.1 hypothetical protein APUTEX25_001301 [Auxenochlorella protothecoides]
MPPSSGALLKEGWQGEVLYGVSPVLAALTAGRREIHALHIQQDIDGSARKDSVVLNRAREAAQAIGCPVFLASKHDLNLLADNRPHQGLMLDCSPLEFIDIADLPPPPSAQDAGPVWLCLDEVTDPQNFGAALRSAFFLGAAGVLTCARNSSPLSGVVSKASAGAMELFPVHSCRNLPATLAAARGAGWRVLGADGGAEAQACTGVAPGAPTLLVMGSEGAGLRTNVRRACEALVRIPGGAGAAQVESLNVSVATGILLHHLLQPGAAEAGQ